jgi:hypothetical protein
MNEALVDLLIDIELLDQTAARAALAAFEAWAYGDHGINYDNEGIPFWVAQTN